MLLIAILKTMNIDLPYIITVILVILVSMTLHEVMHGYISYRLGDDTAKLQGRLTINPLKHIDPFLTLLLPILLALTGGPIFGGAKPVPFNPNNVKGEEWGVALVAIAGPITNFLIAFVSFALWIILGSGTVGLINHVLTTTTVVNLGFFVFNVLPVPPLDGSRVLYALAPDFFRRFMEVIEPFGIIIIFGFVLVMGQTFSNFLILSVNFFVSVFARLFGM
jgi:Zn-dependent protease